MHTNRIFRYLFSCFFFFSSSCKLKTPKSQTSLLDSDPGELACSFSGSAPFRYKPSMKPNPWQMNAFGVFRLAAEEPLRIRIKGYNKETKIDALWCDENASTASEKYCSLTIPPDYDVKTIQHLNERSKTDIAVTRKKPYDEEYVIIEYNAGRKFSHLPYFEFFCDLEDDLQ